MSANYQKRLSKAPVAILCCQLCIVVVVISAPLLGIIFSPQAEYLFLFNELPELIINYIKPYITTTAIMHASVAYICLTATIDDCSSQIDSDCDQENAIILNLKEYITKYPGRYEPFSTAIHGALMDSAKLCPSDRTNMTDTLLGKVRKFKPEVTIDAGTKAVRNTAILFQSLNHIFYWSTCLAITGGALVVIIGYQFVIQSRIADQDAALSDLINTKLRNVQKSGSKAIGYFIGSVETLVGTTGALNLFRTIRDVGCFLLFYLLLRRVDKEKAREIFAIYRYFSSIREAVDKLGSCYVQTALIFQKSSTRIAQMALQLRWDVAHANYREEKYSQMVYTTISDIAIEYRKSEAIREQNKLLNGSEVGYGLKMDMDFSAYLDIELGLR